VGEREIDIRVSTVPIADGERVVLRLLDRSAALMPLSELGMADGIYARFRSLVDLPNGLLVVCGPTGSGKTTTLYAALSMLDAGRKNILTVEDPIEYRLPRIGQIQVKPKIGLTFASGLRHILRQDPDVILVGEIRDEETAEIAVQASLTGHLVFATLHTNDAPGSVLRLLDMGIEPFLVAASMRVALGQRLVRRLCADCRVETQASVAQLEALGAVGRRLEGETIWQAGRCGKCLEGYRRRVGVFELLQVDDALQEMIRSGNVSSESIRSHAALTGMRSLLDDGLDKVLTGLTSADELLRAVSS
jgi:general secretion pathway protein E